MNATTRGRPKKDGSEFESRNEQILTASAEMFAARGFNNTDVEELAAELGIGKGTIYRAFTSKQDLFAATLKRSLEQMQAFIKSEVSEQNVQGVLCIKIGVKAFLRFFDHNPEVIELFIQERAAFADRERSAFWEHCRHNSARWEAFFSDLMEQGLVRQLDARWLGETLNQLLFGQIFLHRMDGSQVTLESRSDNILTIFYVGILTPKGLEATKSSMDLGGLYE